MYAGAAYYFTLERKVFKVSLVHDSISLFFSVVHAYIVCRSFDLLMGAGFASHERNLDEWKALFTEADPRFKFSMVNESNESALAIMEFVWTDLTG